MRVVRKILRRQRRRKLLALMASVCLTSTQSIQAAATSANLPAGGLYAYGSGAISTSGNAVTINQSSLRGIIDWSSFSIGQSGKVTFNNGSGATLNRVTGNQLTSILGSLFASGSVYVINPQGVLIGRGARVQTGGDFVASTLNFSDAAFLSGGLGEFQGQSENVVVNLGDISSVNGSIFLISRQVKNTGIVTALNGTVGLAAGSQVLLKEATGDQRVFVLGPGISVINEGSIAAAQVELKTKGGNIYALAGNNGGSISAVGTARINGRAWLIADGGVTRVTSTVSAQDSNGTGGAIETSGHSLDISGARITTGQGGNWLLDPVDLTVDAATATTIQNTLLSTNVTLQTSANTASGPGLQNPSGSGDININAGLFWSGNTNLTLNAYHGVTVNAPIISTGASAALTILTNSGGTGGQFTVNAAVTLASSGSLNINGSSYTLLNSLSDLQALPGSGHFALNADLDASSVPNFTPLGTFSGTLEGLGHTVSNLTESGAQASMGLFSQLAPNSAIQNLTLTNVSETSPASNAVTMGSLAAISSASIYNATASGQLQAGQGAAYVGGLVGEQTGTAAITNSHSSVAINAVSATNVVAGGLAGSLDTGGLSGSSASGSVIVGDNSIAGGLVGISNGPITGSSASGNGSGGNYSKVGGLVGASNQAISASSATGNTTIGSYSSGGGLVGNSSSTVDGSYATGAVIGNGSAQAGGLIGTSSGATTNSYATGSISAGNGDDNLGHPSYLGGLIGFSGAGGTVSNSHASGTITGQEDNVVGGLVGASHAAITSSSSSSNLSIVYNGSVGGLVGQDFAPIANSYATGTVTGGTNVLAGGLAARDFSNAPISNSYATGNVTSGDGSVSGGLTAWNASPITQSYATGVVIVGAHGNAGGLSGNNFGSGTISNSYATGSVTGGASSEVGGLTGENDMPINQSFATGNVSGGDGSYVGGLSGYSTTPINSSSATGNVTGGNSSFAGGLTGENDDVISQSFATGSVTAGTASSAGGLSGYVTAPISVSYATGAVTAAGQTSNVGGFAGYSSAAITNSYATGAVNGGDATSLTGGFVGSLDIGGSIATSYSAGAVTPSGSTTGGLVGQNAASGNVTASYWNTTTSTQTSSAGGTGLTSSQWLTEGPLAAGDPAWDFTNTWVAGYPYPVLKALPYIVSTLNTTGVRIYGGVDPSFSVSSAVNQNGSNALTLIGGTLIPVTVAPNTGVGTYNAGGSNQIAAGYQITYLGSLTIDPATLTLLGLSASGKVYDGTVNTSLQLGSLSLSGLVGSDTVTLSDANAAGVFLNRNVGNNKPVSVSGFSISGAGAANYVLSIPNVTATITPAQVLATFTAGNKVYDGTTAATASLGNLSGVLSGDTVSLAGSPVYSFTDKNAGVGKAVSASGAGLSGTDAGNYTLTLVQNGGATISPATLTYIADGGVSRPFGAANPIFNGTVNGLVGTDTLSSVASGTAIFSSSAATSSNAGLYGVNGSGLTLTSGNYTLKQSAGNSTALTVDPITITIGNVYRPAGVPNPTFSVNYSGPASDYLTSVLSSLILVTNAPANDVPGTYQITAVVPAALAGNLTVQPGSLIVGGFGNGLAISNTPQSQAAFPAALQTQTLLPPPLFPLSLNGAAAAADETVPPNAISQFRVAITASPDWSPGNQSPSGTDTGTMSHASFTQASPDGRSAGPQSTYAAGAKK